MAMESVELLKNSAVDGYDETPSTDEHVHLGTNGVQDNEQIPLLDDFESYWEELNLTVIVSRVVSDSVMKGAINDVSEQAVEMVSVKELQVNGLKEQLLEVQMLQKLQEELEVVVMQSVVHELKEECEKRIQGSQFCGNNMVRCRDNLRQVSSICKDLEAVQKSLSNLEQLSSHGSLDSDYFHRIHLNNNVFPSSSSGEGSGGNEGFNINLPENLKPDELYSHFRGMITKIKRDHEKDVQAMTEEYYSLKREFLKERGSFLPHKSKDFDVLKKRIPDVISKLNDAVLESGDLSEMCNLSRDEYNSVLLENRYLKDMLNDKEREVKCLSSRVSEAEEKLTQQFSGETHVPKQIEDLKQSLDCAQMEASLSEEVYKGFIRDLTCNGRCDDEENNLKSIFMQETLELIYKDALHASEAKLSLECAEFSDMQTIISQEISGIVYMEYLKKMELELNDLKEKYLERDEFIVFLESKVSEMEKILALNVEEKHSFEQKVLELEILVEEKDKKLNNMMDFMSKQESISYQRNNELEDLKAKLELSLQQIDNYENEVHKLNESLEKADLESREAVLNASSLINIKGREYREQIESVARVVHELTKTFADFELKVALSMNSNKLRLDDFTFQLRPLIEKAKSLRKAGSLYKKKLEKKCSDLQKAEAEVDLLGDEVETLVNLLEKIYIALDHYQPILQHYPGIMEILKLIKREVNLETTKSGGRTP